MSAEWLGHYDGFAAADKGQGEVVKLGQVIGWDFDDVGSDIEGVEFFAHGDLQVRLGVK